jgi:hypothetical protein
LFFFEKKNQKTFACLSFLWRNLEDHAVGAGAAAAAWGVVGVGGAVEIAGAVLG